MLLLHKRSITDLRLSDISKDECSKLGIYGTIIGHVGDANFHTAMFYDPHNAEQKAAVKRVVDDMMHRALEMDGTVSGEHAIGIGKKVRWRLSGYDT